MIDVLKIILVDVAVTAGKKLMEDLCDEIVDEDMDQKEPQI